MSAASGRAPATWAAADLRDTPVQWPYRRVSTTRGVLMDFVVDEVTTPQGGLMRRNYLSHPNAVGIIAYDDEGRIVVEAQYRHPIGARLVEAPAGLMDHPGESPLKAAQRELAEEVGLAADRWQVLVDAFATPGSSSQALRIFLARDLSPVPRPAGFTLEGEEADMTIGWADLDEVVAAVYRGDLRNPTLVTGSLALWAALRDGSADRLRSAEDGRP